MLQSADLNKISIDLYLQWKQNNVTEPDEMMVRHYLAQ